MLRVPLRITNKLCSKKIILQQNFAQQATAKKPTPPPKKRMTPFMKITTGILGFGALTGLTVYYIENNPDSEISSKLLPYYKGSELQRIVNRLQGKQEEDVPNPFLPVWGDPAVYGAIPPGTPAPPLLVLDLERTLIGSVYDPYTDWKHVKRPGVQQFIRGLAQHYEIVILSENSVEMVEEILMQIDPNSQCHKFGKESLEVRDGTFLKRLDLMNRDLSRIILIDDSLEASKLFPRNTLHVKPFTDINDNTDTVLLDLIPLLEGLIIENVQDFPAALDMLHTHEAEEAAVEYRMRVSKRKEEEEAIKNRGLGGLVRGRRQKIDDGFVRTSVLSPSQIVGFDPDAAAMDTTRSIAANTTTSTAPSNKPIIPPTKKKSALFKFIDEEREAAEREKADRLRSLQPQQQQQPPSP